MYAWEESFCDKIRDIRTHEMREMRRAATPERLAYIFNNFQIALALVASCITFYYQDPQAFVASTIFSFMALLNSLRQPLALIATSQNGYGGAR